MPQVFVSKDWLCLDFPMNYFRQQERRCVLQIIKVKNDCKNHLLMKMLVTFVTTIITGYQFAPIESKQFATRIKFMILI
jgi:hypothetical protein